MQTYSSVHTKSKLYDINWQLWEKGTQIISAVETCFHVNHTPAWEFMFINNCFSALGIEEEKDRHMLEMRRKYYLTVRIHDNQGHTVHLSQVVLYSHWFAPLRLLTGALLLNFNPGQNVLIVVDETEGLVTLESTADHSWHVLQTLVKRKTFVQATLLMHSLIFSVYTRILTHTAQLGLNCSLFTWNYIALR